MLGGLSFMYIKFTSYFVLGLQWYIGKGVQGVQGGGGGHGQFGGASGAHESQYLRTDINVLFIFLATRIYLYIAYNNIFGESLQIIK